MQAVFHCLFRYLFYVSSIDETMASQQELLDKLFKGESKSLLKKNLTENLAKQLKDKKTSFGGTLADCIRSGAENLESGTGLYACDAEAYTVFQPLFDAVIKDYHKCARIQHPARDFGDLNALPFGNLDPEGKHIVSTRVRVGRSQEGYGFPPTLNKEKRLKMEERAKKALEGLTGELKGTYYPLTGMTKDTQQKLVEDHFLFNDHDKFLKAAGGYNDWPAGRGIFHNDNKTFLVWVNEEDHLRIISMQNGGNLAEVWKRLVNGINEMEKQMPYSRSDRLGYLTFCPTNLGTTLRASVHMKIPNLAKTVPNLKELCKEINVDIRGVHGEHSESVGGVYDISNRNRLGLTEIQAVHQMSQGVSFLLGLEKALSAFPKK